MMILDMKDFGKRSLLSVVTTLMVCGTAEAQSPSYCNVALTERAFDRTNSTLRSALMYANRDELCNREYNSLYEAKKAASSRGFTLGYESLNIGASKAKQSSTGKWNISETDFCTSSKTDFEFAYGADYNTEVASVAVAAWLDCVKSANENALFIDYKISREGDLFSGILRTTANTGPLARTITGIAVVGQAKSSVSCNIAGTEYDPNNFQEYEVKTTGTAIACEKEGDLGAQIAIQTSSGSTPFIPLPSKSEIELAAWDDLKNEVSTLKGVVEKKTNELSSGLAVSQADLSSVSDHLSRISNVTPAVDVHLVPTEDHQGYGGCPADFSAKQNVCTGDCTGDDSKLTVCIKTAPLK